MKDLSNCMPSILNTHIYNILKIEDVRIMLIARKNNALHECQCLVLWSLGRWSSSALSYFELFNSYTLNQCFTPIF